jgi:cyclohexanone monooxygenase
MADDRPEIGVADGLGFDPAALAARYEAERLRRVRSEGNDQYVEVVGDFARYVDDPYVEPGFTRAPVIDEVEVVVIGGGFGGQLVATRLREAGVKDIRIIEKGGDFGGTWYWNRYPGAQCDIESYIYLPLLEETGYLPKEKYTRAPEILDHARAIGEKFDLYRGALFQTAVTELRWHEAAARWTVGTNRGDALRARFVVMANGPMNRPKLPGIPGVESFKGHTFHTSRWDYDYTGGGPDGGLTGLADKRVAIIGTGATAVQCVPHLGEGAEALYVFQRTPSSIDLRNNRPTDPEWAGSLTPGWHKRRMENFNTLVSGGLAEEDMVADGWTDIVGNIQALAARKAALGEHVEDPAALAQLADFTKMEQVRARVDEIVADPATAEALKPWYNQFCKRPCFHDEYLQTFNRPNVRLIDTLGKGVDRITETAVVAGGETFEIDCIVYATGFEVGTAYTRRAGYELHGRGGVTLGQKWKNGVESLHGVMFRGFPNCFIVALSQGPFTYNYLHMADEQAKHIAYLVGETKGRQARTIEPSAEGEAAWVAKVISVSGLREQFLRDCTPGYYNNEGKVELMSKKNLSFGAGSLAYFQITAEWRAEGSLAGMELKP